MNGKIVGSFVVISALIFGGVVYYTQEYAYYAPVAEDAAEVSLVNVATGAPEPLVIAGFEGIDGSSSPIRYRACFTTAMSLPALTETYVVYEAATPLTASTWAPTSTPRIPMRSPTSTPMRSSPTRSASA